MRKGGERKLAAWGGPHPDGLCSSSSLRVSFSGRGGVRVHVLPLGWGCQLQGREGVTKRMPRRKMGFRFKPAIANGN